MAHNTPLELRPLIVVETRPCANCHLDVMVHDNRCDECGRCLPRPAVAIPQANRRLTALPATAFGLSYAAATMGSLTICALTGFN